MLDEEERGTRRKEGRGGNRDEEEGGVRRKERQGGRSDVEEGATMTMKKRKKKWLKDASLTPAVLFIYCHSAEI